MVDEADTALDFEALRRAGERFGERAGPGAARILILLTTLALGGGASMAARGASLPGFSLASLQAEGQFGVSLAAATGVESALVGMQAVTITFAPGLLAMSGPKINPQKQGGMSKIRRSTRIVSSRANRRPGSAMLRIDGGPLRHDAPPA